MLAIACMAIRRGTSLRALNQCNQLNLLTKKDVQLIMLVEQHPSKLVLHSLADALTLSINTMTQIE